MKRNNAEQIGELIRHYLRQESLESPLNERRLISAWPEVLGPTIASYTRELYIKNQVLYVHLTSAALRQELMMGRELLVRNLNRHVGGSGHHEYHIQMSILSSSILSIFSSFNSPDCPVIIHRSFQILVVMRIQSDDSCTAFIGSDSPELRAR